MGINQVEHLKDRVLGKSGKGGRTELTDIVEVARELGCIGEIIGRDYEVRDADGKLVYTIRQKPIAISQLNTLLKEVSVLKRIDAENQAKMWGKGARRSGRRA